MANENVLRRKWDEVFQQSPDYERAQLAAEQSIAARKAKYSALRARASTMDERIAIDRQEQADAGTGAGEIQLEALKSHQANKVQSYISGVNQKVAQPGGFRSVFDMTPQEPDFANHNPWAEFTGKGGLAPSELVRNARDVARGSGRTFTTDQEIAAAQAQGARTIPDELQDKYNAEKLAKQDAFDQTQLTAAVDKKRATQNMLTAVTKSRQITALGRVAAAKRPAKPGFIEKGGQTLEVTPGATAPFDVQNLTPDNSPYPMSPDGYVDTSKLDYAHGFRRPNPTGHGFGLPPSVPQINPIGARRPAASVIDQPAAKPAFDLGNIWPY